VLLLHRLVVQFLGFRPHGCRRWVRPQVRETQLSLGGRADDESGNGTKGADSETNGGLGERGGPHELEVLVHEERPGVRCDEERVLRRRAAVRGGGCEGSPAKRLVVKAFLQPDVARL
jgi:hypothetical protein